MSRAAPRGAVPPDAAAPAATLTRRERKKREARLRIYRAACELFLERGFDGTTVEEIATRADVAKGTVFNYFPRKTSFLAALAGDWTGRLVEALGPVHEWRGTTRAKLERAFRFLADVSRENPDLSRLAFLESLRAMRSRAERRDTGNAELVSEFFALTREVLRQGQAAGELRTDVDLEHAATLIESAFFRTLSHWVLRAGSAQTLYAELSAKLDIVFHGIALPAGRRTRPGRTPARSRRAG